MYLNDNIESIRAQGAGIIELRPGTDHEDQSGCETQELDFGFDLDAAIAEASKAAQTAVDCNGEVSHESEEDLSAFLAESISKAAEQAKEASKDTELPSDIASAAESASRATMLALERIQQNKYHPTAPPQPAGMCHPSL